MILTKNSHEFGVDGKAYSATRNGKIHTFSNIDTKVRSLTDSDTSVMRNMLKIAITWDGIVSRLVLNVLNL